MATGTFDSNPSGEARAGQAGGAASAGSAASATDRSLVYDDSITRMFATATLVWALVAMLVGGVLAVLLVLPHIFYPLGRLGEYLSFGRLKPLHTNLGVFAFAGNAVFAAIYYSTQRLCKRRMWSDVLGRLHFWVWQAIALAALVTLPLGLTQGKEYAELEWPIDLAVAVAWVGLFGPNLLMTIARRRERHLYVSLWFYLASFVTVTILYVFNNLVLPTGWGKSYSIYSGVQDAMMQWWYGHNAVGFLITMPILGLMYYFVPKASNRPIYSYKLAVLNFWSLVFIYIWIGPHHLHYTSIPEWASTLGMVFSVMLWMPSWAGMLNGLLTLRGTSYRSRGEPVLAFFAVGLICYGVATFGGPLLSIKSVNALAHYTDWPVAHVHLGTLGWVGMMVFGMLYWLAPRLFHAPLWSPRLARMHFWFAVAGIVLYVIPIFAAGVVEGMRMRALDSAGQLVYSDFLSVILAAQPMWIARLIGGILFLVGTVMLATNWAMTWRARPAAHPESVVIPPPAVASAEDAAPERSRLEEAPVLELGKRVDLLSRLEWHRRWERFPRRIALVVLLAVVLGSVVELLPVFLIRSSVVAIPGVQPYTPLELAGRDIYIAEGCYQCHSQQVRPLVAETKRFGEYSQAGEFIYDHPFQWGSRRIGPDLARQGRRNASFWHWEHLENPEAITPGTRMPAFDHLLDRPINFDDIPTRVVAAHRLGAPYDRELTEGVEMAREQAQQIAAEIVSQGGPVRRLRADGSHLMVMDTQAVALIAYLQRLGTDLTRPAPVELSEADESGAGETADESATGEGADTPAAAEVEE